MDPPQPSIPCKAKTVGCGFSKTDYRTACYPRGKRKVIRTTKKQKKKKGPLSGVVLEVAVMEHLEIGNKWKLHRWLDKRLLVKFQINFHPT